MQLIHIIQYTVFERDIFQKKTKFLSKVSKHVALQYPVYKNNEGTSELFSMLFYAVVYKLFFFIQIKTQ